MDRSIKIVQQLERVFEPYRMSFKKLKEKVSISHHNVAAKKRNALKYKNIVLRVRQLNIRGISLFARWRVLKPDSREKRGMTVHYRFS
jgi:hypothetical protein